MEKRELRIDEDVWVPTQCGRCFSNCAVRVRRVNGVAVQIEGNAESFQGSKGGVCGKGASGLQLLYDPNRLNVPLRRTNPEKGLHADPKWKEITWGEALDEITEKLEKAIDEDPRKVFLQFTTVRTPTAGQGWWRPLATVLGTPNRSVGGAGIHCGNGAHWACGMMHGSWDILPDYRYCDYAIYWGVNNGHGTGHAAMVSARLVAEAMERGMKLVVFDPLCNYSGAKATEWVPLIPGTDGIVVLTMCNVILNDLGVMDAPYIKKKTNGPYLVGPDGRFLREKETGKPLVFDSGSGRARAYDDPEVSDPALEGTYKVGGVEARPSFQLLKEHLKGYQPEAASGVSQIPAATIRRIACEFAEAARIGSTIVIDGHELPFRPVASVTFRGGQSHGNAFNTAFAMLLINQIVGAADVPGGAIGLPARCLGFPETGSWKFGPETGPDGMLVAPNWLSAHKPWPVREPKKPSDAALMELFTLAGGSPVWGMKNPEEIWKKTGMSYTIDVLLNFGCNSAMAVANPSDQEEFLKKIPFIVSWDLFANEFAEGFADILLPDTSYLETFTFVDGQAFSLNYPPGTDSWCYHITQPVVEPEADRRYIIDTTFEILDRLGKRAAINEYWNGFLGLGEGEKFSPDERLTWEKVGDRALKHYFGKDHGLSWFREHGFITWPKKIEEAYWRWFVDARVPIYLEFMVDLGEKIREIGGEMGLALDWSQYTPLASWFPCAPHLVKDPSYDLYCFAYRDIVHTSSATMETPWLDEVSAMNPYTYNVTLHPETARKKGLKDGDTMEIESSYGSRATGTVKTRTGQHPETLAVMGTAGHWAKGQPIARGKGTNFNLLMEARLEECDPVSLNLEVCVKVKVRKVER